jgi:DNA-binding transcriptional MerR regulator
MNMDIIQIGNGIHPYAGGQPSERDEHRFATVKLREGERFGLISTKNALQYYNREGLLDEYVAQHEDNKNNSNRLYSEYKARHYGIIRSSNDFADETLGVVVGAPNPGDTVVQRWSAFCGFAGESRGESTEKRFEKSTQDIYKHFVHNQIIQAILRFGRSEDIIKTGGSTVYVSTEALPVWFDTDECVEAKKNEKEGAIISAVIEEENGEPQPKYNTHTVATISEEVNVSKKYVREVLEELVEEGVLDVKRDHGKHAADVYEWIDQQRLQRTEQSNQLILLGNHTMYLLPN